MLIADTIPDRPLQLGDLVPPKFADRSDCSPPQMVRPPTRKLGCCRCIFTYYLSLLSIAACGLLPQLAWAEGLSTGFKVERYARLWERDPFAMMTPVAPQARSSPFDHLFLASWLKDGYNEVIYVENSETHGIQKITARPDQSNLRLIGIHPNSNPELVEAIISDGKEQRGLKFRFASQSTTGPMAFAATRALSHGKPGQMSNLVERAPLAAQNTPATITPNLPNTEPINRASTERVYPGIPRVHLEGGPRTTNAASGFSSEPETARRLLER